MSQELDICWNFSIKTKNSEPGIWISEGVVPTVLVATVVEDADIVQRATADAVTVTIASLDFDFDEELSKRCTPGWYSI